MVRKIFGKVNRYIGHSTDTKPSGVEGDKFREWDTGRIYIHTGDNWGPDLTLARAYKDATEL